jgi:hypothetical protein
MVLGSALTAALLLVSPATTPKPSCFPSEASVDAFRTVWYCGQLGAAQEGRLTGDPSYRFAYIPSFHATRVVLVFMDAGRRVVVGKVLGGRGGYAPGRIARTTRREITADEWQLLEQRLENAGFWEPPEKDARMGVDGAEWVLEGRKQGRYRLNDVWSPDESTFPQFRKACTYMLDLAGIKPSPDELY